MLVVRPATWRRSVYATGPGSRVGVDLDMLVDVGQYISKELKRNPTSRVNVAISTQRLSMQEKKEKKAEKPKEEER